MANFSIAKAVDIPNYRLDKPIFFVCTTYTTYTIGTLTFRVTQVSPTSSTVEFQTMVKRGDVIVLTSTATGYSGQSEHLTVKRSYKSGGAYYVEFYTGCTLNYSSGDTISGYGTGFPHGFTEKTSSGSSVIYYSTIKPSGETRTGEYGFYGRFQTASAVAWIGSDDFAIDHWKEYCWYRAGAFVKRSAIGSYSTSYVDLAIYDGVSVYEYLYYGNDSTYDYVELTNTFLSYKDQKTTKSSARTGNFSVYVRSGYEYPADNTTVDVWVNSIYLEHIRGVAACVTAQNDLVYNPSSPQVTIRVDQTTVTGAGFVAGDTISVWGLDTSNVIQAKQFTVSYVQSSPYALVATGVGGTAQTWLPGALIEKSNSGYYTFTEYPDMGVEWSKEDSITTNRTTNNTLKWFNTSGYGERSTKRSVSMTFTNVAYSFYRKMRLFEDHCISGGSINLHGLRDNLPEMNTDFINGVITTSGFKHDIWDRTKVTFNLTTREI